MNVRELKEILNGVDPDLKVYSYNEEGDYTPVLARGVEVYVGHDMGINRTKRPPVFLIHGDYP